MAGAEGMRDAYYGGSWGHHQEAGHVGPEGRAEAQTCATKRIRAALFSYLFIL